MRRLQGSRRPRRLAKIVRAKETGGEPEKKDREPTRKSMQTASSLIPTKSGTAWVICGSSGWSRRGYDRDRSEGAAARGREGVEGRLCARKQEQHEGLREGDAAVLHLRERGACVHVPVMAWPEKGYVREGIRGFPSGLGDYFSFRLLFSGFFIFLFLSSFLLLFSYFLGW